MQTLKVVVYVIVMCLLELTGCPEDSALPVTMALILWLGYPVIFSATVYEDLGRMLISPLRPKGHASTLLAELRLGWNTYFPEATLELMVSKWDGIPMWVKHELGYFFLKNGYLYSVFVARKSSHGVDRAEYLELFRGVMSFGTLPEFIKAVRMYEATQYAIRIGLIESCSSALVQQMLSQGLKDWSKFDFLQEAYPASERIKVLAELSAGLANVLVASNGKHWLNAVICELRTTNGRKFSE